MGIFNLARRPPQWLRIAFATLLLVFALNSIAHLTHEHDAAAISGTHHLACGYCASFGGLADAPRHTWSSPVAAPARIRAIPAIDSTFTCCARASAQPRAPPSA